MNLPAIVARAEQARTLDELRNAVVDLGLALVQLEAQLRDDARRERTEHALLRGLERQVVR